MRLSAQKCAISAQTPFAHLAPLGVSAQRITYGEVICALVSRRNGLEAQQVRRLGRSYAEGSTGEPCPLRTDPLAPPTPTP
jgi:hypothetical protein